MSGVSPTRSSFHTDEPESSGMAGRRPPESTGGSDRTAMNAAISRAPLTFTGSSSIEQVGGSASSQPDVQKLLTPEHWKDQYTNKYKEVTGAKANGAQSSQGGKPIDYPTLMGTTKPTDYWQRYSGNLNKSKQKPTPGKERNTGEVEKLFPDLDKELAARAKEPSLALYKSQPASRKDIGGHFGDFDQAKKYHDGETGEPQKMLRFTLKPGAHELLFSPKYMALNPTGKQHRTIAELSALKNEGEKYPLAKGGEGFLGGYIGMKAEGDSGFSLGFNRENNASGTLFNKFVDKVEEGQLGEDGEFTWTPLPPLVPPDKDGGLRLE